MKTAYKAIINGLACAYAETEDKAIRKATAAARRIYRQTKASGPLPTCDKAECIGARYGITSKLGMTPFADADTMTQARKLSREAKRLGLSGEIFER